MLDNGIPPDFMSPGVLLGPQQACHWSVPVNDVTIAMFTILNLNTDLSHYFLWQENICNIFIYHN